MTINKFKEFLRQYNIVNETVNYYLHKFKIRTKPTHLLIITTKKCNSRCVMCNIWKNKIETDLLTTTKFLEVIKSDLFNKLKTITFSGGEAILDKRLDNLVEISIKNLQNLKYIGLASNGLSTELIIKIVNNILQKISSKPNIKLVVQISLDSIDSTHDLIRGIPNAHKTVIDTIKKLKIIKQKNSNLDINLSCVILPTNINKINKLYLYSKKNNLKITFSPAILSTEYYKNEKSNIILEYKQKKIAINFLNKISNINDNINSFYYKNIIIPILNGKTRKKKCTMGYNSLVIESNGNIPICINAEQFLAGNIKNVNPNIIWNQEIKKILKNKNFKKNCLKCPASCGLGEYNLKEIKELYTYWRKSQNIPSIIDSLKYKFNKILLLSIKILK